VLYEMLTLSPLFAGEDTPQIAHNVATLEHMPPSRSNAEVTSMLDFVIAKALKKDPELRYQDSYELASDLRTCLVELRGRQAAPAAERNGGKEKTSKTRTVKLDATADKAPLAPAAVAIVSDTRLPLSPQFDCAGALQRLERPTGRDYRLLARAPRPVGVLRRFTSDSGPRLFLVTLAMAAGVAAYVAF
jgi:eukaryotic-like serine/threonine-protein kinase